MEYLSPSACPFPGLAANVLEMKVREGSKIRNLLGFVMNWTGQSVRQVVFTGSGRGITKTISCVEILKRKLGGLHQLSILQYKTVNEVWESLETEAKPNSRVTVQKTVPAISILLSKDPLDPLEPGYQAPETPPNPGYQPPHSSCPEAKRICMKERPQWK
uniref:Ribonuclease P and MRP subunit p25, a n=1 Tax=Esox lucius TaxID=8010 RepID=A0AAY5LB13_ESOLU